MNENMLRQFIRLQLNEIIRKVGDEYVLYTKHKKNGKRRVLGRHPSKASAERQEKAIHSSGG